ncbi:TIR-NBS-LRR resistance protein, partial [Trifolium medium]|nr:TIR-NBS-LRR resistance protein [Trifolium medium]
MKMHLLNTKECIAPPRNDVQLLKEIIKCVLMNLNNKHLVSSKGLIGIDKPMAHLKSLLSDESEDVRVVGIWGMGGIGKTTLAEEVFHQLQSEYDSYCFLVNIREESAKHGMVFLKEKLVSALLDEDVKVDTANGLPRYVEMRIRRMKVLIVLDDVSDFDQLE